MAKVQKGQKVSFLYSSYLSSGKCIDEESPEPIHLTAGLSTKTSSFANYVANCLVGMSENQTKQIDVPAKFAFGERDEKKIFKVPRSNDMTAALGVEFKFEADVEQQRETLEGTIVKIDKSHLHVDTNHPLAGQNLLVQVKVISIQ